MSKCLGLLLGIAAAALCLAPVASGNTTTPCTYVASPTGSDVNPGTLAAPFETPQKLVSTLRAGQTGCLRAGTYTQDVTFRSGGTASARLRLMSYPGETATVVGRMYLAMGADYVTVRGLNIDGVNPLHRQSPMIDANYDKFIYDDITNDHTGICVGIGSPTWGWSTGTLFTHDRVHDCGVLPATNYNHGFYIGGATDTTIEWSMIYANADRGIQLYPEADYTTIDHNIIDGNGEGIIISGTDGVASSHTNVYDNILSNATQRHDVESWWPVGNPIGVGNIVHDNCVWGGAKGTIDTSGGGFTAWNNVTANPEFADAATHNYAISATSPCLPSVGDVQAAVNNTAPTVPASPAVTEPTSPATPATTPAAPNATPSAPGAGSAGTGPSGTASNAAPAVAALAPSVPTSAPQQKHTTKKTVVRHRLKGRNHKRPARRLILHSVRRFP
jgi:Right handed beta helix region